MEVQYKKSLQMIKLLGIELSKEQYNKLAKRFDLLSSESMSYISQKEFEELVKEVV